MNIVRFEPSRRDDLIFMVLTAKNALGRVPRLNEDLLDIEQNYFARGDGFWIALDEHDRVCGCVGTCTAGSEELWLKRLYVRPDLKRRGIGTQLLQTAETFARSRGIVRLYTRFNADYREAPLFYTANGFRATDTPYEMVKTL